MEGSSPIAPHRGFNRKARVTLLDKTEIDRGIVFSMFFVISNFRLLLFVKYHHVHSPTLIRRFQ